MSASGKSSNRRYEENRGYNGTSTSGPYAAAGLAQRESEEVQKHRAGVSHTNSMCPLCRIGVR